MAEHTTPRRNQINKMSPTEVAILSTIRVVENLGADVRLTDAVVLLQAARESVADFLDGVDSRRYVSNPPLPAPVPPVVTEADVLANAMTLEQADAYDAVTNSLPVVPVVTDEVCDSIISALDGIARGHDFYAYGLPIGATIGEDEVEVQKVMRDAVRAALTAASEVRG